MDENEKVIDKNTYRFGRLDAMKQFHVARRLGPALIVAGISVEMISKGVTQALDDLVAMAAPVMQVISQMTDAETDYVIYTCLSVVQRRQNDKWARVLTPDNKTLMFDDLNMPTMIALVIEVLRSNLGNFLPGLLDVMNTLQNSDSEKPLGSTL